MSKRLMINLEQAICVLSALDYALVRKYMKRARPLLDFTNMRALKGVLPNERLWILLRYINLYAPHLEPASGDIMDRLMAIRSSCSIHASREADIPLDLAALAEYKALLLEYEGKENQE